MRFAVNNTRIALWLAVDWAVWSAMSPKAWNDHAVCRPIRDSLDSAINNPVWNVFQDADEVLP